MSNNIHHASNAPQVLATLYLGRNIPDPENHVEVTPTDLSLFFDDYVTPHFPGFTVAHNQGYWKGNPEAVVVVTILAPDSDSLRNQVRQIAEQYKTRFSQEAVAYSFTPCEFTLDCWPFGPVKAYHRDGKGY